MAGNVTYSQICSAINSPSSRIEDIIDLIKRVDDVNSCVERTTGQTPLFCVVDYVLDKEKKTAILKALIEKGFDINHRDTDAQTVLFNSVLNDEKDLVQFYLDNGAHINIEDELGSTPLIMAVSNNNINMVRLLLEYGADPSLPNSSGQTPLSISKSEPVRQLLQNPPKLTKRASFNLAHQAMASNLSLIPIVDEVPPNGDPEMHNLKLLADYLGGKRKRTRKSIKKRKTNKRRKTRKSNKSKRRRL